MTGTRALMGFAHSFSFTGAGSGMREKMFGWAGKENAGSWQILIV